MAGWSWRVHRAGGWAPSAATGTGTARVAWRALTRAGDPVQVAGVGWWRRRRDAAAALAWVSPASRARWLALAAHVRGLPDPELHQLLRALPREVFDRLLEAAFAPEGTAA
jgi:hypothetical protein